MVAAMVSSTRKRTRRARSSSVSSNEINVNGSGSSNIDVEWPASTMAMAAARSFMRDCATTSTRTLICPDKDADGLSAGVILHRTLVALGHAPESIIVHLLAKGSNPHDSRERARMREYGVRYALFCDHGSRAGPALVPPEDHEDGSEGKQVKTLVLDHHLSTQFPDGALVLSANSHPPIATSSALAYELCVPLHSSIRGACDYLCAMGTHGDLGTSFKWETPWPDMKECFKKHTKKAVNEAVSLVNAPRRTANFNVFSAWNALLGSSSPSSLLNNKELLHARQEVNAEVARCSRTPPSFTPDGRIALIRISSGAQVHPVIATRWASTLKGSKAFELVMVANNGYLPGKTNFAVRVARSALQARKAAASGGPQTSIAPAFKKFKREGDTPHSAPKNENEDKVEATGDENYGISIPVILAEYAARVPGLREEMGEDFARGHAHASGGIVGSEAFEKLWNAMCDSEPSEGSSKRKQAKKDEKGQSTLEMWVKKA